MGNSAFGLIDVYNMLLAYIADAPTVKLFQRRLQELLATCIREGVKDWWAIYSPREELHNHKLRAWQRWVGAYQNEEVVSNGIEIPFEDSNCLNFFYLAR